MNITTSSLILFVLVFAVLAALTIVRTIARTRRESSVAADQDQHILAVPELGTTMADGGDVKTGDKQSGK